MNKLINLIKKLYRFDTKLETIIRANSLHDSFLRGVEKIKSNTSNHPCVTVSLTSYNKRIHEVYLVIESILNQTVIPDRLILWLDEGEFSIGDIPLTLRSQVNRGLEVKFCENLKSYKKIIPTLKLCPKDIVITIDDDVLYPHDMIEVLLKEHDLFPDYILCHRAHKIKLDRGNNILPYNKWEYETKDDKPGLSIFPVGIGGVLYPPGKLDHRVTDSEMFLKLAPNADDIWLKYMSALLNVKCKKVSDSRSFHSRFLVLEEAQTIALGVTNVLGNQNDNQLKSVSSVFKVKF